MNQDELIALLSAHEWSDIEFKEAQQAVPKNAYETVAAFANTAGGHLVFGIKKEGPAFEVVGVLDVDKVQNEFISALRQRDKISQILDVKEQLYSLKGKDLLIFYIPEATRTEKPVYLNGDLRRAFIRKGGADVKCSDGELRRLLRDADQERYDNAPLPEFKVETVFDEETVSWYRQQFERRNPEHQKSDSNLDFLYTWNFLLEAAERLVPTRAAVLLFGTERCVRQILPRPVLDYQRIDTPFAQWSPEERWHDRMIFEENIFKTWRGLVGKYIRIAEHPFSLDATTLRRNDDPPDYVSFREAAINLLIHQDYGDHTRKPVIKFFTDQTIFWNPGDAFNTAEELGLRKLKVWAMSRPAIKPPSENWASRNFTKASSMNTSSTPVCAKSTKVVSKVALATGSCPRAANTAKALLRMVPPTQKPKALICGILPICRVTSMASSAPFST